MEQVPSLEEVAKRVLAWRQAKKYRSAKLPKEIAADIKRLARVHKRHHIAVALKMNGDTIKNAIGREPQIIATRKMEYSSEEKMALCQEWKQSGLKMTQFCKIRKISKSSLYQWYRKLYPKKAVKEENWIPVMASRDSEIGVVEAVSIELSLPNQLVARVKIGRSEAIGFLKEFCDATTVIR